MSDLQDLAQVRQQFYLGKKLVLLGSLSVRDIGGHSDVLGALAAVSEAGVVPETARFGMHIALGDGLTALVASQTKLSVEEVEDLSSADYWCAVNAILAENADFFSQARLSVEAGRAMALGQLAGTPLSNA